jgi:tRNA threonylcarbamoyladenosine biosynthesis protein TsaB
MIVLGFDTATPSTAVGLRLADGRSLQARDDPAPGAHPGHATRLLEMAHELLAAAGIGWGELDRIAVGTGPGTFTGLRVGIATARGLAQSLSTELVGIPSLQALALPALSSVSRAADRGGADLEGADPEAVLAVVDARRVEAFAAAYTTSEGDRAPVELVAARALAPEDLGSVLAAAAGHGEDAPDSRWLAVGDGAVRFRAELERLGLAMPADSSPLHRVSAEAICELALRAHAPAGDTQILPNYGRRPDAEMTLEAAAAGGPSVG